MSTIENARRIFYPTMLLIGAVVLLMLGSFATSQFLHYLGLVGAGYALGMANCLKNS